jgi:hypothetical protein
MTITNVQSSDPNFGTGLNGVTPTGGSMAQFVADTTKPSPLGANEWVLALSIGFPNNTVLGLTELDHALISSDGNLMNSKPGVSRPWGLGLNMHFGNLCDTVCTTDHPYYLQTMKGWNLKKIVP